MILEIIKHPNPILQNKSLEISSDEIHSQRIKKLSEDMCETLLKANGAGLAAPQIGINLRLILVNYQEKITIMINPKITKKSWAKINDKEGCLSVLRDGKLFYDNVIRHKKINLIYTDLDGKKIKMQAENLLARIIQHEIDHLDGVLFINRV